MVGIGASAGGLEAFSQLLLNLPANTGMAFVLVQHLDPTHESELAPLLSKSTSMPVREATHDLELEPDHVYVIPPNTTLTMAGSKLRLEPREDHGPHLIDHFLVSLAQERQSGAIGVLLSGAGTDGTLGLEEIRAAGGLTFAQDAHTSRFPSMPVSAARAGCVDRVLSPDRIAQALGLIGGNHTIASTSDADGTIAPAEAAAFGKILGLLHDSFGVDFRAYRDTTIHRRIRRRMLLLGSDSVSAYAVHIEADRPELDALYQDILINVTSFFRDPEAFKALKTQVLPELMRAHKGERPLRVWVPGCSTGQEPYSIAMTIVEFLSDHDSPVVGQIFATDLSDTRSLVAAREGLYPASIEAELTPERLARFFTREERGYRVVRAIRDMVVFARQNVVRDPPFSHLDLISCRNLLIYLAPAHQKRVIPTFHYALNPGGFLLLGSSEAIGPHTDLFDTVDATHRIYTKRSSSPRQYPHFRSGDAFAPSIGPREKAAILPSIADWQRAADRIAFGQYVPPGVLVSESLDILQFRGDTSAYLTPAPGTPSHQLFRMAREGLFAEIRAAVAECIRTGAEFRRSRVLVHSGADPKVIDLHVWPVQLPLADERCFLIQFEDSEALQRLAAEAVGEPSFATDEQRLRSELAATRDYMQAIIGQHEAVNEALRSANEEILSSNEELQSTNEELETAKEELQSVNEELTTVNEQLQTRNAEANHLNDDLQNLLNSALVGTVMMDRECRIRLFTPSAAELLELTAQDTGQPLARLATAVTLATLPTIAARVMAQARTEQSEVRHRDGRWLSLRVHPYRTAKNHIAGVVAVFVDIDDAKRAQLALQDALQYAKAIVETVREPLVVLDAELHVRSANPAFYATFRCSAADTEGHPLLELGNRQWNLPELRCRLEAVASQAAPFDAFEVRHDFPSIGAKVMTLSARRIAREAHEAPLILLAIEDHTVRAGLELELREHVLQLSDTDRERTVFLALLAHELRNPLAPIRNALHIITNTHDNATVLQNAARLMERQVDQLVRLVDDLIDVSRISRGMITLRTERVNLSQAVQQALDAVRPQIDAAKLSLENLLPEGPVYVEADPTRLAQCIGNLLHNACKFTPPGGRIRLTTEIEAGFVSMRVTDNGIGLAAVSLPLVFDMFMQVDTSLERSTGGLGIGLALVKHLVELHGGTLTVTSVGLGQGSEFTVRLPLAADQSPLSASPPAASQRAAAALQRRILVVDDNPDAAHSLTFLLKMIGHEVQTALDGPQALEIAATTRPDAILLDIGLPRMSGLEVARRIRAAEWGQSIKLIALTGWGKAEDREQTRKAGFDTHLVKPVNIAELIAALATSEPRGE